MYYRIQDTGLGQGDLLDADRTSWHISDSEELERKGTSVCGSLEDLAKYFATTGLEWHPDTSAIVLVDGYASDDNPVDDLEYLIHCTEYHGEYPISSTEIGAQFMALLDAELEA